MVHVHLVPYSRRRGHHPLIDIRCLIALSATLKKSLKNVVEGPTSLVLGSCVLS